MILNTVMRISCLKTYFLSPFPDQYAPFLSQLMPEGEQWDRNCYRGSKSDAIDSLAKHQSCLEEICSHLLHVWMLIMMTIKGVWSDHFWIHPSKWSFWYQIKAPIFLITPVKYDMQQMLILKVTSKNVAKVQKLLFIIAL